GAAHRQRTVRPGARSPGPAPAGSLPTLAASDPVHRAGRLPAARGAVAAVRRIALSDAVLPPEAPEPQRGRALRSSTGNMGARRAGQPPGRTRHVRSLTGLSHPTAARLGHPTAAVAARSFPRTAHTAQPPAGGVRKPPRWR